MAADGASMGGRKSPTGPTGGRAAITDRLVRLPNWLEWPLIRKTLNASDTEPAAAHGGPAYSQADAILASIFASVCIYRMLPPNFPPLLARCCRCCCCCCCCCCCREEPARSRCCCCCCCSCCCKSLERRCRFDAENGALVTPRPSARRKQSKSRHESRKKSEKKHTTNTKTIAQLPTVTGGKPKSCRSRQFRECHRVIHGRYRSTNSPPTRFRCRSCSSTNAAHSSPIRSMTRRWFCSIRRKTWKAIFGSVAVVSRRLLLCCAPAGRA